jgi:hypothetical protein
MSFIKRQLIRSFNLIKDHWDFLVGESNDNDLTRFGNFFIKILMIVIFFMLYTDSNYWYAIMANNI